VLPHARSGKRGFSRDRLQRSADCRRADRRRIGRSWHEVNPGTGCSLRRARRAPSSVASRRRDGPAWYAPRRLERSWRRRAGGGGGTARSMPRYPRRYGDLDARGRPGRPALEPGPAASVSDRNTAIGPRRRPPLAFAIQLFDNVYHRLIRSMAGWHGVCDGGGYAQAGRIHLVRSNDHRPIIGVLAALTLPSVRANACA